DAIRAMDLATSALVSSPAGSSYGAVTLFGSTRTSLSFVRARPTFSRRPLSADSPDPSGAEQRMAWRMFQVRARVAPPIRYRSGSGPVSGPDSAEAVNHADPAATVMAEWRRRCGPVLLPAHQVAAVRAVEARVSPTPGHGAPPHSSWAPAPVRPTAPVT